MRDNVFKMQCLKERCYKVQIKLTDLSAKKVITMDNPREGMDTKYIMINDYVYSVARYNSSLKNIYSDDDSLYRNTITNTIIMQAALTENVPELCDTKGLTCAQFKMVSYQYQHIWLNSKLEALDVQVDRAVKDELFRINIGDVV